MMEWIGKVALVTGASSGIGARICKELLLKHKMVVIAVARNKKKLMQIKDGELKGDHYPGEYIPVGCDLSKQEEVMRIFDDIGYYLPDTINLLVNNAMGNIDSSILFGSTRDWKYLLEVGVMSHSICNQEAAAFMQDPRYPRHRQIIQIGNLSLYPSLDLPAQVRKPSFTLYDSVKAMNRSLASGLRKELRDAKSRVKVSTISLGPVKTELFSRSISAEYAEHFFKKYASLQPEDVTAAVNYILSTPPHVEVHDIVIEPMVGSVKED